MNLLERAGQRLLDLSVKLAGGQKLPRSSQPAVHTSASMDGRAVYSAWNGEKAVAEGMKVNAWVYSAINVLASGMASVPLVLEKRAGDGWQPEPAHEIQALLNRANPFMGRQDMQERWVQHMMLSGNALFWLNIVGGKPVELWPINPDTIKPRAGRADFIRDYEWKVDGSTKRYLPVAEVAHWQFPDPVEPRWGLSPLMAAAGAVDMDQAAAAWNRKVLRNDGKPPFAVLLGGAGDRGLTYQEMSDSTRLLREQVDGSNTRQLMVLGNARGVTPLSLNASDLDFLNGRKFSREEIAAVFGVPPILLAFGEGATFANLDAAERRVWEGRIVPLLDDLCQGYMGALFPFWELTEETHRIRYDLSNVRALQSNLKTEAEVGKLRAEAFAVMVNAGVPANMAAQAAQVPLADIPGGDQPRQTSPPALPSATKSRQPFERKEKGDPPEVAQRLARMDEWTDEVRQKVAKLLLDQGNSVASAYASGKPWEQALSVDDWRDLLSAVHTAVIEAEGALAYAATLNAITGTGGGVFDVLADGVTEWIDEHVGDMVKGITDTSKLALKAEITAGVEAGESVRDIAKRLKTVHEGWSDARATLIARQETASAFGAAHQLSAEQIASDYDVEMVKTWVATRDSRTRDSHKAIDGETVPIDEPFSIGVMAPPEGFQCRCVVTYAPKGG